MRRVLAFVYGVVGILSFMVVATYLIGFLANTIVPKSIDSGNASSFWQAVTLNVVLLGLFAIQHSVMARPRFKQWWTKLIPKPIERSTYVVISSLLVALLLWQWHPMRTVIWDVRIAWIRALLWGFFGLGWVITMVAGSMLSFTHMFGLKQTYRYFRGLKPTPLTFQKIGFYRYIRHPVTLGFLIGFWATPHMTSGHLLFAVVVTVYMLIALIFEERDLVARFGAQYSDYQKNVPMLFPMPGRGAVLGETPNQEA
jgi:protein-S-isoprenylcysteine O-methyltransferase Ste14